MLWEITIHPKDEDNQESHRLREEYNLLTHSTLGNELIGGNAHGYLVEGAVTERQVRRLMEELLVDALTDNCTLKRLGNAGDRPNGNGTVPVLLKPGVMDPVAQSVLDAAGDIGIHLDSVSTFRRY